MHQLIERLWQRNGFTALLVIYDVQEAVALAGQVILIEDMAASRLRSAFHWPDRASAATRCSA